MHPGTPTHAPAPRWQFWIDRGGTFTDIVARRPDGTLLVHKLLSENPERYADAALQGIRELLGLPADAPLPAAEIEAVKMGTTVGTNALLERRGARVAFVTTAGFGDVLRIGYQHRPDIFALHIRLPEQLYERVIEVPERYSAQGEELLAVDRAAARAALQAAYDAGIRALAVAFLHAYRHPEHERQVGELAREIGFTQISLSHQVSPLMRIVGRGDTTVVDAYLSPLLRRYVAQVEAGLAGDGTRLLFMQSNGGLVDARFFEGRDCILSGPAGGIVGAVKTAAQAGFHKLITFDMGGTSTDAAHYDGDYERRFETEVAGVRLRVPMMNIHTVAAGGGSILHFDGSRYRVGPDSAGANPGPASYRRGGPLTVTDCNVMLGRLQPDFFPRVFGPAGDEPLDVATVRERFARLADEIRAATGDTRTPEQVAEGFLTVAVEQMADAIKAISVQRGYDVTGYTLCCFGGAGGQHACRVADTLGMTRVFLHPFAGVLSAYGMGLAEQRVLRERAVEAPLDAALMPQLEADLAALETEGRAELQAQGIDDAAQIRVLRKARLRYAGTDTALLVDFGPLAAMQAAFEAAHRGRYGFLYPDKACLVEALLVELVGETAAVTTPTLAACGEAQAGSPLATVRTCVAGAWQDTPVHARDRLQPGVRLPGPAIIVEPTSTMVVEPGWQAELTARGELILTRHTPLPRREAIGTRADPVMLEIFNRRFMSIAEQMGYTLQNTSFSVNIKERLDFSCALFDGAGQLIANAPHIPVHLGSMGESVQSLIRRFGHAMAPGDVYLLNSPYAGGTHLPDITVITPVFDEAGDRPRFYVASRGHHADVGGITPGSMPPLSTRIDEEGVLSEGLRIVAGGRFLEDAVRAWLAAGPHPARNPAQNIADLRAQVAANARGAQELQKLVAHYGLATVQAYMQHVQDNAEEAVRRVLDVLRDGSFRYRMDDGAEIAVAIRIDRARRRARIDFSGTSPQQAGNFNAPAAICKAAVLYVFRTLVRDEIPLNAGCLRPLDIVIPAGSLLNPKHPAAVVAGNVETSQYIVDALYGALGVLAGSQGTMNNLTFGDGEQQYYETICGGSGAGPDFDGTGAVQTHMTNSRITDPEVLEWRFPVLLERFAVRHGSGGAGRRRGGDGVVRRLRFRAPMTAAILSSHRLLPPFGLAGGAPGACGRNWVERADGRREMLPGKAQVEVRAGDVLVIETPGGGGHGAA
ncbi:MAG: hydantoinase B/oxoprolinase family protein [Pseudomonadota bacterium]